MSLGEKHSDVGKNKSCCWNKDITTKGLTKIFIEVFSDGSITTGEQFKGKDKKQKLRVLTSCDGNRMEWNSWVDNQRTCCMHNNGKIWCGEVPHSTARKTPN